MTWSPATSARHGLRCSIRWLGFRPAGRENAAIEKKVHPTGLYENIDYMRGQLKAMGLSLDWKRRGGDSHPDYYRHQQKMFVDFFNAGLAYRRTSKVNWGLRST